jgi:hypothetical protein
MTAQEERIKKQNDENDATVEKERRIADGILGRAKNWRPLSANAKGCIVCVKKGDFAEQTIVLVSDYVRRHLGACIVVETKDPAKDYKLLEETLELREVKPAKEISNKSRLRFLCFKKGDMSAAEAVIVREYVHRRYGPCFIFELTDPDRDLRVLEVL